MIIQHNMPAQSGLHYLKQASFNQQKSIERLSSGHKINQAADDAANLAISVKTRSQIRGLLRSTKNAENGISFVQVVDAAMGQVGELLQRMRELGVQSLNDTYTQEEKSSIQKEVDQLKKEIDKLNQETKFNEQKIFGFYDGTYYSYNGNRRWNRADKHQIDDSNNLMHIIYQTSVRGKEKKLDIEIENGTYTTEELCGKINEILEKESGDVQFELKYNDNKTLDLVMRDGGQMTQVSGGLTYLFSGGYAGTDAVSLIGTTIFHPDYPLSIISGKNDELSFDIENFDDTVQHIDIKIPEGNYTRQGIIDFLNGKLKGTGMEASPSGDYSIQIGGENGMISGLKGNMFQIDDKGSIMVSVFYDNTRYGKAEKKPAYLKGASVLTQNAEDTRHNRFIINAQNNKLRIKANAKETDPYKEITLNTGSYTISGMKTMLQQKLTAAGIDVTVEEYSEVAATPYGKNLTFAGLELISNVNGEESSLVFDVPGSSAYNTLFVNRVYDDPGTEPVCTKKDSEKYTCPSVLGTASFQDADFPFEVTADNDSFRLHIVEKEQEVSEPSGLKTTEKDYLISLTQKNYASLDEIISELNTKFNAVSELNGKLKAVKNGSQIKLTGDSSQYQHTLYSIGVSPETGNLGYESLFVGHKVVSTPLDKSSGYSATPVLKLPASILNNISEDDMKADKITIDSSNASLSLTVNGLYRQVVLKKGVYTRDDLAKEITAQLKEKRVESINTFGSYSYGKGPSNTTYSKTGEQTTETVSCDVRGTGKIQDGSTFIENPGPAVFTMPVDLKDTTVIDSSNNTFSIQMNGTRYDVVLTAGSYDKAALAKELNDKLASEISNSADKVTVSLDGKNLKFTSEKQGEAITMSFGNTGTLLNSSFLDSICTTKKPAVVTVSQYLNNNIVITSSQNTFEFMLNNVKQSVTLDDGTYNRSSFITELNKKLSAVGVTASLSGTYLQLTTKEEGNTVKLSVNPANCGTAGDVMYQTKTAASQKLSRKLQDTITIPASSNQFKLRIDKSMCSVSFQSGKTYTREELVNEMNSQLSGKAAVSMDSNGYLTFTTVSKGSSAYISLQSSYSSDDIVKAMFGTTVTIAPDVTASFTSAGELLLTGADGKAAGIPTAAPSNTNGNYRITAKYMDRSFLQPPVENKPPTVTDGIHEVSYYELQSSNPLSDQIAITKDNKNLSFYFHMQRTEKYVSFVLEEKIYTREQLQNAIQAEIDNDLGAGQLGVTVTETGITFQAQHCGPYTTSSSYNSVNNYYISRSSSTDTLSRDKMSGSFYDYIMSGDVKREEALQTELKQGELKLTDTYIIGRRDIRNTTTRIRKGETDALEMDVTFTEAGTGKETVYSLKMLLEEGDYSCHELLEEIQNKLDKAVLEAGLPAHSIFVDVGHFDSGVAGADDSNAINFYMNTGLKWEEGSYKIDGLRGNSMPAIFYSTTGDPIPAYILGTKDISKGVKITPSNNKFSINIDNKNYEYEIPRGNYTEDEFLEKMNEIFKAPDINGNKANIKATTEKGCFKISYRGQGKHNLNTIQGTARSTVFYADTWIDQHDFLRLQVGSNAGQELELQKTSLSTFRLGIDTISFEERKNASRALKQIDRALNYINGKRAVYGAYQNRLEHIISAEDSYYENLEDADSRRMDADMAEEIMKNARNNILKQAGMSIQASTNSRAENALQLLK